MYDSSLTHSKNKTVWLEISKCILIYKLKNSEIFNMFRFIKKIFQKNQFVSIKIYKTNINESVFNTLNQINWNNTKFDNIVDTNYYSLIVIVNYQKWTNILINKTNSLLLRPKYFLLENSKLDIKHPILFNENITMEYYFVFLKNIQTLILLSNNKIELLFDSETIDMSSILPNIKDEFIIETILWNKLEKKTKSLSKENYLESSFEISEELKILLNLFPKKINFYFYDLIQNKKNNLYDNTEFKTFLFDKNNWNQIKRFFDVYNKEITKFNKLSEFEKFLIYEFSTKKPPYKKDKPNKGLKFLYKSLPVEIQEKYKKYL